MHYQSTTFTCHVYSCSICVWSFISVCEGSTSLSLSLSPSVLAGTSRLCCFLQTSAPQCRQQVKPMPVADLNFAVTNTTCQNEATITSALTGGGLLHQLCNWSSASVQAACCSPLHRRCISDALQLSQGKTYLLLKWLTAYALWRERNTAMQNIVDVAHLSSLQDDRMHICTMHLTWCPVQTIGGKRLHKDKENLKWLLEIVFL